MKASKALNVSVSIFRGQIPWHFSLSKIGCSRFGIDIVSTVNAHAKLQQHKLFETDFIDSQKPDPPFVLYTFWH